MFWIKPTPDARLYVSQKGKKLGKFSIAFERWLSEIGRDEIFASFVCGTNGLGAENFDTNLQLCKFSKVK